MRYLPRHFVSEMQFLAPLPSEIAARATWLIEDRKSVGRTSLAGGLREAARV
jgi:hypothetical protein